jgi:ubiquinone/menaquinone biosynthesis C-methylase UbiE
MADIYATIADADPAVVEQLVQAMEIRSRETEQGAMLDDYLAEIDFPAAARVLDIGCGSGVQCRALARRSNVAAVVGVDPSEVFLGHARRLSADFPSISFERADGRTLPFAGPSFDVVTVHTVLSHVPEPERILVEANRVMKPGGWLAVFDGDYATTSLSTRDHDPLQCCADVAMTTLVHDRWLVRRLPSMAASAGFDVVRFRTHGYVQTSDPSYTLTLADRGADALVASGCIGAGLGGALKEEARRRADAGAFYAFIAYASLIARKPAT